MKVQELIEKLKEYPYPHDDVFLLFEAKQSNTRKKGYSFVSDIYLSEIEEICPAQIREVNRKCVIQNDINKNDLLKVN